MRCCVSFTPDVTGIKSLVVDRIFLHLDGNHQLTFFFFYLFLISRIIRIQQWFFFFGRGGGIFAESLIIKSWILTLTEASETFTFFRCCSGFFFRCSLLESQKYPDWQMPMTLLLTCFWISLARGIMCCFFYQTGSMYVISWINTSVTNVVSFDLTIAAIAFQFQIWSFFP